MTLAPAELVRVGHELETLVGAHVQKVYLPRPRTGVLELRLPGQSLLLLLEADAGVGRAGVVSSRPQSPERPIALQGLWRAQLTGARLDRVETSLEHRVLRLALATDHGPRTVVLELASRGGNLLLLGPGQKVLSSGAPGRGRDQPYQLPPAGTADTTRDRLAQAVGGEFPVSGAIEQLYEVVHEGQHFAQLRAQVLSALRSVRKRAQRTLEKAQADRTRIAEAAQYQRLGDLLKPSMHALKRGATEARVTDYAENGPVEVTVPLLPHLSPRENVERYYHLHRRLSRSAGRVDERLALLTAQTRELEALLARAEAASDAASLEAIQADARTKRLLRPEAAHAKSGTAEARVPYRQFHSATGHPIWVGRNARDNDSLTFRYARGNDLWLHARGQSGSHVVVPGVGADGPDGETLLDAATLAAHFSAARDEAFAEVAATRRKYVHKPRNAAPGAVHFSQERTIPLRMEAARLARLLATEGSEG